MKTYQIGQKVEAKFAVENKQQKLKFYRKECNLAKTELVESAMFSNTYTKTNWRIEKCVVEKIIVLSVEEYEVFSNNLLTDNEIIARLGGDTEIDNEYFRLVTVIQAEGKRDFVVDPQGYDYARYVGINVKAI